MEWQTIETAPKDKRILCCWLGAPGYEEIDVAVNCTEKVRGKIVGWCSPNDCDDLYGKPGGNERWTNALNLGKVSM